MKHFFLDIRHIVVDGEADKPVMIKPVSPDTFSNILISDHNISKEELDIAIRTIYTYFVQHKSSNMAIDIRKIDNRFCPLDKLCADDIEDLFGYHVRGNSEEVK